jgi:hypothetical protein
MKRVILAFVAILIYGAASASAGVAYAAWSFIAISGKAIPVKILPLRGCTAENPWDCHPVVISKPEVAIQIFAPDFAACHDRQLFMFANGFQVISDCIEDFTA